MRVSTVQIVFSQFHTHRKRPQLRPKNVNFYFKDMTTDIIKEDERRNRVCTCIQNE